MASPYHHGDLRRALLDAAAAVLADAGVAALSLRDLARRVGVSAAAPYHHFANKAALVDALAEDMMARLDGALADAAARATDPLAQARAVGVAYVQFAVAHPDGFRLAFRPELGTPVAELIGGDDAVPAEEPGFRHLWAAVTALGFSGDERADAALSAWALVHGLAALLVDGPLQPLAGEPARVRALAEAAVARLDLAPRAE